MKKVVVIGLAVLISVAFVSAGLAAEKEKKMTSQKSVKLTGEVVKNDGKEMSVKGPKGEEKFDVSKVKNVDKYKEGDKVTISYKEKDGVLTASSISKPIMKGKTEKKEMKEKMEKPSEPMKSEKPASTK